MYYALHFKKQTESKQKKIEFKRILFSVLLIFLI